MTNTDDLIPTFLEITSTEDVQVAKSYLEMSDGNLDTAVNLFFENGGADAELGHPRNTNSSQQSGENVNSAESDEDIARKLQRQMYEEGTSSNNDNMRQPIQAVHEQLIPEYGFVPPRIPPERGMFGSARRGVFNQAEEDLDGEYTEHNETSRNYDFNNDMDDDDDDHEIDYDDEYEDSYERRPFGTDNNTVVDLTGEENYNRRRESSGHLSSTQKRLARLFRPPWDIISKLDFDSAKKLARDEKKWVLINIQDVTDFRCQCLNRDFWSSNQIKDLVKQKFIFLQFQHDSPNGQLYRNLYPFKDYPHIAIIDPWTGERMKVWSTNPEVHKFIDDVADFTNKFSLDKNKSNVNLREQEETQKEGTTGSERAPIMLDENEDDEEENENDDADTSVKLSSKPATIPDAPLTYTQKIANIPENDVPDPSCAQEETTRIQIRSGLDGKRVVKRFALADPVSIVFQYVKFAFKDSLQGRAFTLKMQRQNLFDDLDKSISEAGLRNASILLDVTSDEEDEN